MRELAALLGIAILPSLVGLGDDLRGLHPLPRFVVEVGAAIVMWWSEVGLTLVVRARVPAQ